MTVATSSRECAAQYTEDLGWSTAPAPLGGKAPLGAWKKYQTERLTGKKLSAKFGTTGKNIFIITGTISRLCVLDCDSTAAVEYWRERLGPVLDETTCATSGRESGEGRHFYFRLAEGEVHKGRSSSGDKTGAWDLRAEGNGVIAPPSKHASGSTYTWERGPEALQDAPEALWDDAATPAADSAPASMLSHLLANRPAEGDRNNWLSRVAGHYAKQLAYQDGYEETVRGLGNELGLEDEEIEKLIKSIWQAEQDKKSSPAGGESGQLIPMCTDLGNSERLARRAAKRMRYVSGLSWLWWDGKRWRQDTRERVREEAKTAVRGIYAEAAQPEDSAQRERIAKWAKSSEAGSRINAMVELARSDPRLRLKEVTQLDALDNVLNVQNGILDLDSLELKPHDPNALLTKIARAAYDPTAQCPFWESTLEYFLPDEEIRDWVQRAAGYSLLGTYSEWLFIPFGLGANGKSTFLYGLRDVSGDYAIEAAPELLTEKRERNAGTDAALADLRGARLVTTIETQAGKRMAEALMKQLTGESIIKAKLMRENYFEFENRAAIWLATNHKPIIQGTDHGVWRRVCLIPFEVTMPDDRKVEQAEVKKRLHAERDGILRWLIDGLRMYREHGLEPLPAAVIAATAKYRAEMDTLGEWREDCCTQRDDAHVPVRTLRESYEAHCEGTGRKPMPGSEYIEQLEELGLTRRLIKAPRSQGGKADKCWVGIELSK
jgi:putative DNA primase/helicase